MLLSEGVYNRVPLFWLIAGLLFLFLGLSGGKDLDFFFAYILFGVACIGRSVWIYQARWKRHKRNEMSVARPTVIIKHPISDDKGR